MSGFLLHSFMLLLVSLLGADKYQTREFSHCLLKNLLFQTDNIKALDFGRLSKDPEIRNRCSRIIVDYENVPYYYNEISLYRFATSFDLNIFTMVSSNYTLGFREQTPMYIQLLFESRKYTRRQIIKHIREAEWSIAAERIANIEFQMIKSFVTLLPIFKWSYYLYMDAN